MVEEIQVPAKSTIAGSETAILEQMILIRRFEEKAAELYGKEKIRGFLHLYNGQEAIAAGVLHHRKAVDKVISTYREHGHALASGVEPRKIMAELFGKTEGCSGGRGGSMHLFDVGKNFFGGNAIVGGHLPVAVGMALADKKLNRESITFCFFGEGAVAEGIFHESMNLAGLLKVPALFILENNLYAMGTHISFTLANSDFSLKARGYGLEYFEADGMNPEEVAERTAEALQKIRSGKKPALIVFNTYRFRAHSMFDAELYRAKDETEQWKLKDPLRIFAEKLKETGITEEPKIKELYLSADRIIEDAVAYAEAGHYEAPEDLTRYLTHAETHD
ncbi:MAG: thiamine pyrophosphate-dependent enzyme [Cyclobacteriaceae bacterium]